MKYSKAVALVAAFVALSCPAALASGDTAYFTGLGFLPGDEHYSEAYAVSSDGSVVVGLSKSTDITPWAEALRWTESGGMTGLGFLPGGDVSSVAHDVSADGTVIVGSSWSGVRYEAVVWTENKGVVGLGDLPGGDFYSKANGVSSNGLVVVGNSMSAASTPSPEAFRWTQSQGMVGLGDFPGGQSHSEAIDVSADGSVIVGTSNSASGWESFRWTEIGGMVGLGHLPASNSPYICVANAISADGSVIVGWDRVDEDSIEAFRWTQDEGMVGLGDLPGGELSGEAHGVSADGSVIVGKSATSSSFHAFVWDDANGIRDLQDLLTNEGGLDLSGWTLTKATSISADGTTVVGFGTNPTGDTEAWIARLGGRDCNTNSISDESELAAGSGSDCNLNARLDECDIAAGSSPDCDGDGFPNDCITCVTWADCDDCSFTTRDGCYEGECLHANLVDPNALVGDIDRDGDFDLRDWAIMSLCFTGPDGDVPGPCPFRSPLQQ